MQTLFEPGAIHDVMQMIAKEPELRYKCLYAMQLAWERFKLMPSSVPYMPLDPGTEHAAGIDIEQRVKWHAIREVLLPRFDLYAKLGQKTSDQIRAENY